MKRMKRWLGIMMSVMLAAGSLQVPVYAAETGTTAVEAEVDSESTEITNTVGAESEVDPVTEEYAKEEDPEADILEEESDFEDIDIEEDTQNQTEEQDYSGNGNIEQPTINEKENLKAESGIEHSTHDELEVYADDEIEIEDVINPKMAEIESVIESGDCGATINDHVTWTLTGTEDEMTLTISGQGEMADYKGLINPPYVTSPWASYKSIIRTVVIEYGITHIGELAFYECRNLTSVVIPNSVMNLGSGSFAYCSSITDIMIPDGLTRIENSTFAGCSSLTDIDIPDGVTSIEASAFDGCSSIVSIIIPNNIEIIGDYAFARCSSLTNVTIPKSVAYIGNSAFFYCLRLTDVYYEGSKADWDKISSFTAGDNYFQNNVTIHFRDDYMVIGRDSNSFLHFFSTFGTWSPTHFAEPIIGEGRIGRAYPITLYYYVKLLDGVGRAEEVELLDRINSTQGWRGSCQGLAISLAMAYLKKLNISNFKSGDESTPSCYDDLIAPVDGNLELRDVIHYFQLLQSVGKIKRKKQVKNMDGNLLNDILAPNVTLPGFWKSFVNDIKEADLKKIPLLFSMGYGNDGHSLLTCGYDENDIYYIIKFYDPNFSSTAHGDEAVYLYLFVDKSNYNFWFSSSGTTIQTSNAYANNNNWRDFAYYGEDLWNTIDGETEFDHNSKSSPSMSAVSEVNSSYIYFTVTAGESFRIENSKGQYLEHNSSGLQGTLKLYDFEILGDSSDYRFKLEYDNNYTVTEFEDGTQFGFRTEESYVSTSLKGASKFRIKDGKNIIIDGTSMSYNVRLSMNNKNGLIELDGDSTNNTIIEHNDEEVVVKSDDHVEIEVKTYDNKGNISSSSISGDNTVIINENDYAGNVSIEQCGITLSNDRVSYTGKEQQPAVNVKDGNKKLIQDTDFTVLYENNVNPGTATVTITGIGSYTGTVAKTFMILPGKTMRGDMFNLANNVKVTWKEVPGAKYYKIYREGITNKKETQKDPVIVTTGLVGWDSQPGLTNGNAYRYKIVASLTGKGDSSGDSTLSYSKLMYRLKTVVIRSVKNTAAGKVTVKYDKTTSGDSYVLQYCERQDMVGSKTKVVLGANNTSYVIGGLMKGKTYYISIRVRKKVKGIDYYTTFGVPKKVTVTK